MLPTSPVKDTPASRPICTGTNLLWHARFEEVPRYAAAGCAQAVGVVRERARKMAEESAPGIPLELIGLITPLPDDGGVLPGEVIAAYLAALDRLGEAARHANVLVPGHGAVARSEIAARLAADRAYVEALQRGVEAVDARLDQEWLAGPHESNLDQARRGRFSRRTR